MPQPSCSYSEPLANTSEYHKSQNTPCQSIRPTPTPTAMTSNKSNLTRKTYEAGSSRQFSTPRSSLTMVASPAINQSSLDEEWKQQVSRHLVIITNRLKEQNQLFDHIINYIEGDNRKVNQPNNSNHEILKKFPITEDVNVEEIDVFLQEENNFNSLGNAMTRAGGEKASEIVRRVMTRLLVNDVAVLYSWHGHKGKKKFSSLKLASVVYEAAKKNKNASHITEKEVEIIGARWLTKALDRMKKRT